MPDSEFDYLELEQELLKEHNEGIPSLRRISE